LDIQKSRTGHSTDHNGRKLLNGNGMIAGYRMLFVD
jgi:hypothetical protein